MESQKREEEERRREVEEEEEEEEEEEKVWIYDFEYGCYDVVWNLLSFVWIAMFLRILGFLI